MLNQRQLFSIPGSQIFKTRPLNTEKVLTHKGIFALIFAVGVFAHWPALISDSNMWDDWIILAWITQGRLDWMFQFFHNYGVTPYLLVYFPFVAFLNDAFLSTLITKILSFSGVIVNATLITLISKKISHENLTFATLAGISAVCFPAISGEGFHPSMVFFYFFIPLFLIGVFLFIKVCTSTTPNLITRAIALVTLFISFSFNSLLVMFYALIPAVFYAFLKNEKLSLQVLFIQARVFLIRYIDFLALPLVFWVLKETFMPREGPYARYNKLNLDWAGILTAYKQLIPDLLQTTVFVPFSIRFALWIAVSVFISIALSTRPITKYFENTRDRFKGHLLILLGLGFIALCGTALPYYIVGRRSFEAFGFMSRDNILFPLSTSWITAALFCMLLKPRSFLQTRILRSLPLQQLALGLFAALIVIQSLANWRNHADWQAHYAYYRSVIEKLTHDTLIAQSSVIHIIDNLPRDRTLKRWKYPTSIWTEIVSSAFQKTERLAIPFPPTDNRSFTQQDLEKRMRETEVEFMLSGIDLNGKQSRLTIEPTNQFTSPILLALTYWKTRFFAPTELPRLLDSLTHVKCEPIEIKGN